MSKTASAFRTISEVSDDLDVPKHVLRFWEQKFSQVRPMKRGGGRRYYRPEDLDLLRGIRDLLHREGYTIKGVQRILREQGVDVVKASGKGDVPVADRPVRKKRSTSRGGNRQKVPPARSAAAGKDDGHANTPAAGEHSGTDASKLPPSAAGHVHVDANALRVVRDVIRQLEACKASLTSDLDGRSGVEPEIAQRSER